MPESDPFEAEFDGSAVATEAEPPDTESVRDSEAEYALEYAANCPSCAREIRSLRVARLLRTRVNFVSTLPRRGRVLVCPHCRAILSAELGTLA
jgi:hypothetical protein